MNEHKGTIQICDGVIYGDSNEFTREKRKKKALERHEGFLRKKIMQSLDCFTCSNFDGCGMKSCTRYKSAQKIIECDEIIREIRSEH